MLPSRRRSAVPPAPAASDPPTSREPADERLTLIGPNGALRVTFLRAVGSAALEADVREVTQRAMPRPALAVALGNVALRHKLDVRVIPRIGQSGPVVIVIFGTRGAFGSAH